MFRQMNVAADGGPWLSTIRPPRNPEQTTIDGINTHFRHSGATLGEHFPIRELGMAAKKFLCNLAGTVPRPYSLWFKVGMTSATSVTAIRRRFRPSLEVMICFYFFVLASC
jgi:hypothetical protein